jgi:predicted cobalt transporter CbtA
MDTREAAIVVIGIGFVVILIGIVIYAGGLGWFGQLPGDIHIERGNTRFFFPVTSMIVISVGISLLLAVVRRLL